jgi:hypothetical protein
MQKKTKNSAAPKTPKREPRFPGLPYRVHTQKASYDYLDATITIDDHGHLLVARLDPERLLCIFAPGAWDRVEVLPAREESAESAEPAP